MFSKMIAGLRLEAEKVSGANCAMLANSRGKAWELADKFSGQSAKNRATASGAALGMGGVLSLIGVAMANQAAGTVAMYTGYTAVQTAAFGAVGLSTSAGAFTTMLAGASATLAGLGTVAVGSAILPVATVIALGAGVAGVAVLGISRLMRIDRDKGHAITTALINDDRDSLNKIGRQDVGMSDWLVGAKNWVVKSLQDSLGKGGGLSVGSFSPDVNDPAKGLAMAGYACDNYELEDLFGETFEESAKGQQAIVEKIGASMWEKLGVVVTDDKIHACLGGVRGDTTTIGKILDVDLKTGLVIQSLGRGQATVHNWKDFAQVPVVGQDASISYKAGKMQGAKEQGNELDSRTSVGR